MAYNKEIKKEELFKEHYKNRDVLRCINDICKENLKGKYEILFNNITDANKFPEKLKFIAFGWEELKVIVYREPELKIYTFEDYNKVLSAIKFNEDKFLKEGLEICNKDDYKRIFFFKDLDKQKIKELKKGDKIIRVGDFLNTNWGYDQTNVELFVIKKILGNNYFIIQEVAQQIKGEIEHKTYYNVKVADNIKKIDIPIKAFISNEGYMSICEYGYKRGLYLTNMEESHYKTNTQYGH